jgi:hypothetical protein
MAKWIVRRSRLSQEYARVLRKAHIAYFFFVVLFMQFFILSIRDFAWWQLFLLFLAASSYSVASSTRKDIAIYRQGIRGEKQVLRILRRLDKSCLVVPNALIGQGKRFEVDALVCTKGIVSLIEVKHYKGTIERKNGNWFVRKNGRMGNHRKQIGDPIEQLQTRMRSARQQLDKKGLQWALVQGVLVFAKDTSVDSNLYTQLQREKTTTYFLSRNEGERLLEQVGTWGDKGIPGESLYEALVGK